MRQDVQSVVTQVILCHFCAQKVFADLALLHTLFEQAEKERFLIAIRVLLVISQESIFAEQFATGPHDPGRRWKKAKALGRPPICG